MSTLLESFVFGNAAVRIVLDDQGEPWFVAKDVAEALEYPETSLNQMVNLLQAVPDEWKTLNPIKGNKGTRDAHCLSEPGLYWFVSRSDKEAAIPFQKWVFGEELPSIRKTGGYTLSLNMDEVKQIMRLPEAYKKETYKRMLAEAGKEKSSAEAMQLIKNISLIFAAAETGTPLEQGRLNIFDKARQDQCGDNGEHHKAPA